ncbi:phage tail tube protein [uncultured Desulfuromonas sp.]|uniref:phage tail tube protein n=1 Tax=uncultured Desulfuromonas sp. TaxID=181013 RepID=UPI002AABE067|nr:phage tail tube protein [uncultured Desulfuromonas sp.]
MPQATGANGVLTISGAESPAGQVPATPAGQIVPFSSESLQRKTALDKSNIIRQSRDASAPTRGKRDVSGSISTNLTPNIARLLMMAFGNVTTTGAGPEYSHVFKIGDSLPYHTIEKGFTDLGQYFRYFGCKCNKVGFEVNPSGVLPLSMDFMGMDRSIETETFDAAAVDIGYEPFNAFSASIKEGGVDIAIVTSMKWSLENNLDGDVYCIGGQGKRYSIPEGATVVSGSITALFESEALLTKATNGTASSLEVSVLQGTGLGTEGNEKLMLNIDELIFEEQDPIIKDTKGILIELPWTAYWGNGANGTSIMATLLNTQASAL